MIVCQNTTGQWFRIDTQKTPAAFFGDLRTDEETDTAAGRAPWVDALPLEGFSPFGPELRRARIKLEQIALFGVADDPPD